jgi:ABC-type lipopolysaccharide export system ATPase subunit
MRPSIWVEELQFSDGRVINIAKDEIIVFVGPNNAGKSVSLKETVAFIQDNNNVGKVIKSVKIKKEGELEKLKNVIAN